MTPISRTLAAAVATTLAACMAATDAPATTPDEVPFVAGQGSDAQLTDVQRDVARIAIDALAAELQVSTEGILVDTVRAVDWPDSSIGCPKPDRAYLDVVTPGHKVTLRKDGQIYVVHEAGGKAFLCEKTKAFGAVTPKLQLAFGQQMAAARQDLAKRLRVDESTIKPLSGEQRVWDDTSIGCPVSGESYDKRRVDGWVLVLGHNSRVYTYHTDMVRTIPCPAIATD